MTPLTLLSLLVFVAACSVRNATLDARTWREMAGLVRAHGWWSLLGFARMIAVMLLLVAAGLCQAACVAIRTGFGLLMASAIRLELHRPQRRLGAA